MSGQDDFGATTAFDLMSYSRPAWISPYNYCKALTVSSGGRLTCPSTIRTGAARAPRTVELTRSG